MTSFFENLSTRAASPEADTLRVGHLADLDPASGLTWTKLADLNMVCDIFSRKLSTMFSALDTDTAEDKEIGNQGFEGFREFMQTLFRLIDKYFNDPLSVG